MTKKRLCFLAVLVLAAAAAGAQQLTRFAVVDTARVYNTFFRDSAAVRNYDAKKDEFQKEIDRLTEELKTLQARKVEMEKSGDSAGAVKLEADIIKKATFLTEYTKAKNTELDALKTRLNSNDAFYASLYDVIGRIAESDGYTMVLSLQQGNAILWYSPTVDITDKVILALNNSAAR